MSMESTLSGSLLLWCHPLAPGAPRRAAGQPPVSSPAPPTEPLRPRRPPAGEGWW